MTVPGSARGVVGRGQARDVFFPRLTTNRENLCNTAALQSLKIHSNHCVTAGDLSVLQTLFSTRGHGFKQNHRIHTTDATGVRDSFWEAVFASTAVVPKAAPSSLRPDQIDPVSAKIFASEFERTTSFLNAGGIAAVHARGRDREAIWDAMKRREVFGTSGHRMLVWFDLINGGSDVLPMGSETEMSINPRF